MTTQMNSSNQMHENGNDQEKLKKAVKSVVRSMVKTPEEKYFDQIQVINPITAGNLTCISDITRGVEVTQRVGNEVSLKYMDVRISASLNANITKAAIRYIIFVDTMGVNAPGPADILEIGLLGTVYTDISPYNWDYRKRFRIKRDEVLSLTKGGTNEYLAKHFRIPLNIKGYNIGAGTTFKNAVYIMMVGAETNVLNLSTFQYGIRLVYTDE